jgi:hypothetical protein
MDIQGFTPVSTVYEYVGHTVGLRLGTYLIWNGYIVFFVMATAFLRLYYLSSLKGSFSELGVYPVYVFFMFFLLYPVEVSLTAPAQSAAAGTQGAGEGAATVRVPRVLAHVSVLTGTLQQYLIRDFKSLIGASLHEWERLAAINEKTRIMNTGVRTDLQAYARYCYWPTMAVEGHPEGDPWELVPMASLSIDGWLKLEYEKTALSAPQTKTWGPWPMPCSELHSRIGDAVADELRTDKFHRAALSAWADVNVSEAEASAFYRRRILYNELFVANGVEGGAIRDALPEFSLTNGSWGWDTTNMATEVKQSDGVWDTLKNFLGNLPIVAISVASTLSEWWSQKAMGPATLYRISALGPHIYGMVTGFLFMLFPIAGVMAFWPKWWSAIINFMKLFLSVKLWPILWAFLSAILSARNVFDGTSPSGFQTGMGTSGIFPALCSMYLMVPMLSFMMINLAHHAGGAMLGAAIGSGEAASLGESRGIGGVLLGGAGTVGRFAVRAFNPSHHGGGHDNH